MRILKPLKDVGLNLCKENDNDGDGDVDDRWINKKKIEEEKQTHCAETEEAEANNYY